MRTKALLLNSILMLGITFSNLYDSLFVPFIFTIEFMLPFFNIGILHPDRTLPTFFVNNMYICVSIIFTTQMSCVLNLMREKTIMNVHRTRTLLNSFLAHHLAFQQFFWHPAFSTLHRRVSYILNMPIGNQMSCRNSCTHLEERALIRLSAIQYAPILSFQGFSDRKETEQRDFLIFRTTHLIFMKFILDDIFGTP